MTQDNKKKDLIAWVTSIKINFCSHYCGYTVLMYTTKKLGGSHFLFAFLAKFAVFGHSKSKDIGSQNTETCK